MAYMRSWCDGNLSTEMWATPTPRHIWPGYGAAEADRLETRAAYYKQNVSATRTELNQLLQLAPNSPRRAYRFLEMDDRTNGNGFVPADHLAFAVSVSRSAI